jgi:hypothetical protein
MSSREESADTPPVPSDPGTSTREEIHFRRIDMRAYRRNDGLYEVEGRVTDRKSQDLRVPGEDRVIRANDAIHDMGVVLVFDEDLLVHDVTTFTDAAPHGECPRGGEALQSLVGLKIQSGWSKEVRARLRGARSCTHLMELLIPIGTAAFQALTEVRFGRPEPTDAQGRPLKIDSCFAYREDGLVVLKRWPQFSTTRRS